MHRFVEEIEKFALPIGTALHRFVSVRPQDRSDSKPNPTCFPTIISAGSARILVLHTIRTSKQLLRRGKRLEIECLHDVFTEGE